LRPYAIAGLPLILGEGQHLKQQWRRQSHPVGVLDPSFGVQDFPHEKICGVTSDEPIGGKPPATAEVSSSVLPPVSSAWSCRCGRGSPSQIERQGDFKETLPVQYCTGKKTTLPGTGTYRYRSTFALAFMRVDTTSSLLVLLLGALSLLELWSVPSFEERPCARRVTLYLFEM
jgi:hypothetical protein